MKREIVLLIGAAFILAGCGAAKPAESISDAAREKLLSLGFKPDPAGAYVVTLEHVRLIDAARLLDFSIADLKPTLSQSWDSDVRTVTVGNMYVLVYSEVRDNEGRVVPGSLDSPEAVCTVKVGFTQSPGEE